MITLYQPPGAWGSSSVSPFCIKLETWLRMMEIPYVVKGANPQRAPKGKVPYIRDEDGALIGDSQLIIQHLTARHGDKLDAWLDPVERAKGHAVRRMLEEGSYWVSVHNRWVRDEGYAEVYEVFSKILPAMLAPIAIPIIRRNVRIAAYKQGTGRHSVDEIEAIGRADYQAVSEILGHNPYLLGEAPSSVDATLYAFLVGVTCFPVKSTVAELIERTDNLMAYRERMKHRFWPESAASESAG